VPGRATPTPVAGSLALTGTITPTVTPSLTPTPQFSPTPLPTAVGSEGWLNLLLLGLDSRANLKTQNTDVIIILSINPQTRQISILSIPRDLWVYIPTYGWSRINTAHKRGYSGKYPGEGPALLAKTIEMNLGIPIDHWARIDYQGFIRAVDAMGGVDMTVACPVNLQYLPLSTSPEGQILQPGVYHMDGSTALRYVRTRRGGSDFDRARRQQQFLRALWHQTKELDLGSVVNLFTSLRGSITSDLTMGDVQSLASLARELQPQRIRSRYIGAGQTVDWTNSEGWRVLLPRYDKIQQVVAGLYAPPSAGEDQAASEGARVQIRNGTARPELAQILADELRWHGLGVVDAGPADRSDYARTQILVFNDKPKAVDLLVQVLKSKSADVIRQPDPSQPADIQVILGSDYDPCQ
jgi:LCP family protein required for cell wall assembly